jgi:spoIIIJ-associated protein
MEEQPSSLEKEEEVLDPSAREDVAGFCREVVQLMGLDVSVRATEQDRIVSVNLTGPDRPLLLSNAAAVLNSLEFLANKAFLTGRDASIASIVLDSDHYRKHREAELVLLAEMASKKVLKQRRPLSLQPMTPKERRIVHLALATVQGVRSESDGEGENRSVTIYPV